MTHNPDVTSEPITTAVTAGAFSLSGLSVLVTGGTAGIGEAIAVELGAAGAGVAVASRGAGSTQATAAALRADGVDAIGVAVDVRDADAVQAMTDQVTSHFGRLDVLVNCAGGSFSDDFRRGPLLELDGSDLLEAFRLNVVSAFNCSKAAVPVMRAAGGGAIINIASVGAFQSGPPMGAYGTSKAAMIRLSQAMAVEWAPDIRVNAVAPGAIDTPRTTANRTPERTAQMLGNIALGRFGVGADVAYAVRYLASPAGAWQTGSVIRLDGGQRPMA